MKFYYIKRHEHVCNDMHPNITTFYLSFTISMEIIFDKFISSAFLFIIIRVLNIKYLFSLSSELLPTVQQHIIVQFHVYILIKGINMRRGGLFFKFYLKIHFCKCNLTVLSITYYF